MEMDLGHDSSRKRKLAALEAPAPALAAAEPTNPEAATENRESPLPGGGGEQGGAVDRISHLPDGVLGDIISLLPTEEGARTQILASRWRNLWRSAPLNIDLCKKKADLDAVVPRIFLSAHPGPGRRFCAPVYHLQGDRAYAWLWSPALDNLQELELCSFDVRFRLPYPPATPQPLPAAAIRFSETLCVAIIGDCQLHDSTTQALHFPKLKKLALERASISESSLHTMIAGCPALECLLLQNSYGFCCLRINSFSLKSIGCNNYSRELRFRKLIIENAPCLERLLQLGSDHPHTSVISAPKLETLGCLGSYSDTILTFDSTVIQGLRVDSLTTAVHTVKILSINLHALCLDVVIELMKCFPCLERLYIESTRPGKTNFWRRKHQDFTRSFDIRLKKISWRYYRGTKSHVSFATFFVENARVLELMIFEVYPQDYNEEYFAQQCKVLQLDKKASRGAQFRFTRDDAHLYTMDFGIHDLDLVDPFQRKDSYKFRDFS